MVKDTSLFRFRGQKYALITVGIISLTALLATNYTNSYFATIGVIGCLATIIAVYFISQPKQNNSKNPE